MKILNALPEVPAAIDAGQGVLPSGDVRNAIWAEGFNFLLRLLSPIAPHITHVLWRDLGFGDDVLKADWPQVDESALARDVVELVVQVNGKLRGRISVAAGAGKDDIEQAALAEENVQRFVAGKAVKKIVVVPGRLVNIVAAE